MINIGGEKIFACIASIPEREYTLRQTIQSILPQVHKVYLFLNNYKKEVADEIKSICPDKIEYIIGDNSLGDAGKFYWADKLSGYILTLDDDIEVPLDYAKKIITRIEDYQRKVIVSFHGRVLKFPITSYKNCYENYYPFNKQLNDDVIVHVGGTGCMGWHTDTMPISIKDFPSANMADIYLSILAQKNKVPIVVLSHADNWIKGSYYPPKNSISGNSKNDDKIIEVINEIPSWEIHGVLLYELHISTSTALVINLLHRTDRYSYVSNECLKIGITPIRIDAINGKDVFSDVTPSPLFQSHYGCTASHIKALELAATNDDNTSLIIEDDCVFEDDFKNKLFKCAGQLPNDWDLLYLGGSLINKNSVNEFSENLREAKNVLTTHAYIIRNSSIPKLLSILKSRMDKVDILFCEFQKTANCFIVYPELAWQRAGYSDIIDRETNNTHLRYSTAS